MNIGLEAAAILLFIMTSPCIDRQVVNEDAIVASMVLMKHSLGKNILPAVNATGHIVAAAATATTAEERLAATPEAPNKKRRRSRASLSTSEAATMKDMKKVYISLIMPAIGYTVALMERLEALIETIPLDENHLMTCSAAAMHALELDPSTAYTTKACHLQVAMVNVVTAIFRKYPKVRGMIIEDLFPLMLQIPTGKKSIRTFPVQCSSILYPHKALHLSRSLLQDSPSVSTATTAPTSHQQQESLDIQPLTVLIVRLVQASVVKPTFVSKNDSNADVEEDESDDVMQDDGDGSGKEVLCVPRITSGLRGCQIVSDLIVKLLIDRCTKKGEDGGASEFRPILSNLIDDLLLILLVPEYPASEMILLSIVNTISADISNRSHKKLWKDAEPTYLNTIFDALGKICAAEGRIRKWNAQHPVRDVPAVHKSEEESFDCYCGKDDMGNKFVFNCDRCKSFYHGECVGITRDRLQSGWLCDGCQLGRIVEFEKVRNNNLGELGTPAELVDRPYIMRRLLIDYLSIVSSQDSDSDEVGVQDAYGFHLARWLNELNLVSAKITKDTSRTSTAVLQMLNSRDNISLMSGLMEMWDPKDSHYFSLGPPSGVSESLNGMLRCMSDEGRSRIVVDLLCKLSSLLMSFQHQVGFLVKLMESSSPTIRKLSLKAIEKIAHGDPVIMLYPFIRQAVIRRFVDESISVREAAVSLVGSYVVNTPDVANAFHKAFMVGLADPGVSVRKRTICVLQDILSSNAGYKCRAEACSAMLRLSADPKEDDSTRDLVYDLFSQLWLEGGNVQVRVELDESPASESGRTVESTFTPSSKVSNVEVENLAGTPMSDSTEALTPHWSTDAKNTRSTSKKRRSMHMQKQSEVAAAQMVEVVKFANTEDDLTSMFRELFSDVPDTDKGRRVSMRKKRQDLAKKQCRLLVDALFEMLVQVDEEEGMSGEQRGKDLVAIFRTIQVFTAVSPVDAKEHMDTMVPYFKAESGLHFNHESEIARALCTILSQMVPRMDETDLDDLADPSKTLAADLERITTRFGREATASAVEALCLLSDHEKAPKKNVFSDKVVQMARSYYSYLLKHKDSDSFKKKARENVKRALSVMGAICQFCQSSTFPDNDDDELIEEMSPENVTLINVAPLCEKLFGVFLLKSDTQVKCVALRGLTGIFTAHPREMLRMDQSGMIESVMSKQSPHELQQMALRCWRDILLAEESRIESGNARAQMERKKEITMSKKISGDQDADATLFGGILTNHVKRLFAMTCCRDVGIRKSAVELIGHLLRQGQVNPNDTVPVLLALQGDLEASIRLHALKLLMHEGERRPDMLRQRLRAGIKRAFFFQKAVYPQNKEVMALIAVEKEDGVRKECVFGSVYKECISSNKKQRRGLFRELVSFFDPQTLERGERKDAPGNKQNDSGGSGSNVALPVPDLELLSYTSQVLAYLPYGYASDPLYIIHTIDSIVSVQGPELVDAFASFLRPHGLAGDDEYDDPLEDEDDIEEAAKRPIPHHAKEVTAMLQDTFDTSKFLDLCLQAGCLILLLRLKSHLRQAYNLGETRCRHFNPQDKNTREAPVMRSSSATDFFSKMPLRNEADPSSVDVLDCMIIQYDEFRKLMRSENGADAVDDEEESDMDENERSTTQSKKRRVSLVFDDRNDEGEDL
jgi:cohesin loading factor subunit SCC2